MSTECDLMKDIARASNNGNQDEFALYKLRSNAAKR